MKKIFGIFSIQEISVTALVTALIGITISFTAMSSKNNIIEDNIIQDAKWSIHFKNLSSAKLTGNAKVVKDPLLSDFYLNNFEVSLNSFGDSVSYSFDVINDGTLDAKIASVITDQPHCISINNSKTDEDNVCNNIKYKLTYTNNNMDVMRNDILNNGDSVNLTLTVSYDNRGYNPPSNVVYVNGFNTTIVYEQN